MLRQSIEGNVSTAPWKETTQSAKLIPDGVRDVLEIVNTSVLSLIVGLFGFVANAINCVVFSQLGFKDTINISLFSLSLSDLFVVLTWLCMSVALNPILLRPEYVLISQALIRYTAGWMHVVFTRASGALTVFITMERCLCVVMPLKVKEVVTPRVTAWIMMIIGTIMFLSSVPQYFAFTTQWTRNEENRSVLTISFVEHRFLLEYTLRTFSTVVQLATYSLMPIFTVFLIKGLRQQAQLRSTLKAHGHATESAEKSMSSKDQLIVKMVILVAIILIVFSLPNTVLVIFHFTLPGFKVGGSRGNLFAVGWSFAGLFSTINSSINIFVYYRMSTAYREKVDRIVRTTIGIRS